MTTDVEPLSAEEFELYVAALVRTLEFGSSGVIHKNKRFDGVRQPGSYEIDVALEVQFAALNFTLIVECKNWKRPVDRPVVQKLAQTRDAISADKAAIASPVGFTKEAEEVARTLGVALWVVTLNEWIVVYPQGGAGLSSALIREDSSRNWTENPVMARVVSWRDSRWLRKIPGEAKGKLPVAARWARLVSIDHGDDGIEDVIILLIKKFIGINLVNARIEWQKRHDNRSFIQRFIPSFIKDRRRLSDREVDIPLVDRF